MSRAGEVRDRKGRWVHTTHQWVPGQLYLKDLQLLTSFLSQQLNLVVVVVVLVCDLLPPVVGVLGESML